MSGFLNNSVRVYPIKLKIGMLDHMNNTFENTVIQISVDVPLKCLVNWLNANKISLYIKKNRNGNLSVLAK